LYRQDPMDAGKLVDPKAKPWDDEEGKATPVSYPS
jgi:hypothetical protein